MILKENTKTLNESIYHIMHALFLHIIAVLFDSECTSVLSIHLQPYICMYICMYVCMYVCMHACVYVCIYVSMYV